MLDEIDDLFSAKDKDVADLAKAYAAQQNSACLLVADPPGWVKGFALKECDKSGCLVFYDTKKIGFLPRDEITKTRSVR